MNEPEALSSHEGEEIIYVLSGEVEFWCKTADSTEPVTRTLHPGDCLHFSSRVSHGFRAIGAKDAEALFVYAMPPDASMPPAVKDRMPARKK
jgi:quercetin dioxygenase-like cupin family protein